MPTYSTEFKDDVVRKMMPPNSQSIEQVGQELGLSRSTLYAWKQQYRAKWVFQGIVTGHFRSS